MRRLLLSVCCLLASCTPPERGAAGSDTPAQGGWYGEQKVSRIDALEMYRLHPVYAAFEADIKGSISPGKLADRTVLGGKVVYRKTGE